MLRLLVLFFAAVPVLGSDPPKIRELSPVPKAEPRPNEPIPLDVNKYRFYSVDGYAGPVTWLSEGGSAGLKEVGKALTMFGVIHGQSDPGEYDVPPGALIVWGKEQGTTKVTALGVVDGKAKVLLSLTLQVGPRPPPTPEPKPKPDPVVVKGLKAYLVVEETDTTWPERGASLVAAKQWADKNGVGHRWVDQDVKDATGQVPSDLKPWLDRAKGRKLPMIYLVGENGKILAEQDLPLTKDGLLALLQSAKGN